MISVPFPDRQTAGKALAEQLKSSAGKTDTSILCLVRGGIVIGHELSKALCKKPA